MRVLHSHHILPLFVWIFFKKLSYCSQHCLAILPGHLVEMTTVAFLVKKTDVALGLFLAVNANDGSLSFFEPAFSYDCLLIHAYLVTSESLP